MDPMIQESRGCNALTSLISFAAMSVSPAVAGGSAIRIQNHQQYRRLIIDPPATAGGTDINPNDPRVTRLQCVNVIDELCLMSVPPAVAGGLAVRNQNLSNIGADRRPTRYA